MESSDNQYLLQWREHVLKAADALKKHDYEEYEFEIGEMHTAYEAYKKDKKLEYEGETSFGAANDIFESVLSTLFIKNQNAVKDFVSTVREDKNLQSQFMFYETLKHYKPEYDRDKYLEEAVELALKKIDNKTLNESNAKLYQVLKKHNIKPDDYLNEDNLKFYHLCETIFANPKSLSNLAKLNETFNQVAQCMVERAELLNEKESKPKTMTVQEFANKCNLTLTESEKSFLSILLSTNKEAEREQLYETQRKECLKQIELLLNEADSTTQSRLNSLLASIQAKKYNKETILEDIVKIMEVSEILNL